MLDINKCELIETRVADLSDAVVLVEEGSAMVHFLENGLGRVKPATGAANEVFAGFVINRPSMPGILPYFEELVVPAATSYTVNLGKTMSGSDLAVYATASNGTRTKLTAGAASNANEYSISNGVITVNSSRASQKLTVVYNYAVSLNEARLRYEGNEFYPATTSLPAIGLCPTGEVFITNYDITADWAGWDGSVAIKLASDGRITVGGSGSTIPAVVTAVPGIAGPFLGIRINMGN